MARFSDAELDALKSRVDLPALIRARGVELKPHGDGHLAGKCPFHADDTPSFIITPGKGLFHCLGCGAAGNAIQFVMKSDGLSFRHAVELLRGDPAKLFSPLGSRPRVLECPLDVNADDATLMHQVFEYYARRLRDTLEALAYLAKRGVCDPEAIKTHRIGYADRSLGLRLPEKNRKEGKLLRERLTALGLYRESGHEHFSGCIVFPIFEQEAAEGTERRIVGVLKLPGPNRVPPESRGQVGRGSPTPPWPHGERFFNDIVGNNRVPLASLLRHILGPFATAASVRRALPQVGLGGKARVAGV